MCNSKSIFPFSNPSEPIQIKFFRCHCEEGWKGEECNVRLDECEVLSCYHKSCHHDGHHHDHQVIIIIRLFLLVITNIVITSDQNHHLAHDDNLSSCTRCLTAVDRAIALQVILTMILDLKYHDRQLHRELNIHIMKNSRLFILYGASKGLYFE